MEKTEVTKFVRKTPIHVSIPNIEIYLTSTFFSGLTDRPRRAHSHPCYELVWINSESGNSFIVNPPLVEHISADAPPENVHSFLFKVLGDKKHDLTSIIGELIYPVRIDDTFGGGTQLSEIKLASQDTSHGSRDLIEAELRLFFIKLSRALYMSRTNPVRQKQTLDEKRPAILEEFFNIEMKNPDCTKQLLASKLGVCERQLTRILKETYNSSFSAILLRSRMNLADAMLKDGTKTLSEIADAVGYSSLGSMKNAYFKFFGRKFKRTNDNAQNT